MVEVNILFQKEVPRDLLEMVAQEVDQEVDQEVNQEAVLDQEWNADVKTNQEADQEAGLEWNAKQKRADHDQDLKAVLQDHHQYLVQAKKL